MHEVPAAQFFLSGSAVHVVGVNLSVFDTVVWTGGRPTDPP